MWKLFPGTGDVLAPTKDGSVNVAARNQTNPVSRYHAKNVQFTSACVFRQELGESVEVYATGADKTFRRVQGGKDGGFRYEDGVTYS